MRALFAWWSEGSSEGRRALVAAALGWMLDSFDVMIYALVLTAVMPALGLTKSMAGLLASLMLLASAAGGIISGIVADRYGRTRALMGSILLYSFFSAACGFSQTVAQLAVFRVLLGLGMGGVWASGAALVSETWPAEHRGKALGFMQSSWAVGYGAAALVTLIVLPRWGWRVVFFVGVLPALLTVWIQRSVSEPAMWRAAKTQPASRSTGFSTMFKPPLLRLTLAVTIMNAFTMFGWWGFNTWLPSYLSLPPSDGGVGLSATAMSGFVILMQVGMWCGYVTFGFISDAVGRKRAYVAYTLTAAALIAVYVSTTVHAALLVLGPFVAFFATGYFSGFGAVTAEIYPTNIRATAQGFTYNIGRVASAVSPFTVGSFAETGRFREGLLLTAGAFLLAAVSWTWIPETKGRQLV